MTWFSKGAAPTSPPSPAYAPPGRSSSRPAHCGRRSSSRRSERRRGHRRLRSPRWPSSAEASTATRPARQRLVRHSRAGRAQAHHHRPAAARGPCRGVRGRDGRSPSGRTRRFCTRGGYMSVRILSVLEVAMRTSRPSAASRTAARVSAASSLAVPSGPGRTPAHGGQVATSTMARGQGDPEGAARHRPQAGRGDRGTGPDRGHVRAAAFTSAIAEHIAKNAGGGAASRGGASAVAEFGQRSGPDGGTVAGRYRGRLRSGCGRRRRSWFGRGRGRVH